MIRIKEIIIIKINPFLNSQLNIYLYLFITHLYVPILYYYISISSNDNIALTAIIS